MTAVKRWSEVRDRHVEAIGADIVAALSAQMLARVRAHTLADLRKRILAKPGANPKRIRIASYWKQGEAGHHEELSAND